MTQTTRFQSDDEDPTTRQVAALPCVGDYPVIGQYILCSQLGAGGAGAVYMGYHVKLQRPVAIKILNPAVLKMSDKAIARFTREAILSSQIRSNHIIPVTDAGTVPGTEIHYIIMDLVDGENAEDRVSRKGGQLSVVEALAIIRDATIGLADAHRQEVIHRDLKPANIMISAAGEVRLADLGIATSFDRPNLKLTQSDEFLGTPQYMSPEQIRGDPLDGRTDVYSMGVTLHHLLTGVHPFQGPTAYAVMQRVESETLPDIREFRDDVPANVAGLIQAATQRDRDERIPSSEAMVSRLEVLLRKQGQVTLADPEAGGENRSRYVELPSEELQKMLPEVERIARATAGSGVGRKGVFAALVVVLLLVAGGIVASSLMAETPIDRQVRTAMQETDHPAVADGLADALTSTNLNAPARAALVREVATWVANNWETPEAYLDAGDEGAFKVLTILVSEQSEPFEAWLLTGVDGKIDQKDWAGLDKLLDRVEQWGGLHDGLRDQVARRVAQPFEREVRNRPTSPIGSEGRAVLNRMAALGSDRCKGVARLQALSAQPTHSTGELREWFTLAQNSNLLSATLDDLLAATQRTLVESGETARDVLPMLAEFSQASPAFEKAAVDRVIQYARQALANHDWAMALSAIDVLRALPSSDPAAIVELERGALAAVAGAADLTPAGLINFPGNDPGPLLQALVQRGVPGAVRWLIEARVTWNDEDRMVWRDGVTLEQKTQFPDLVRRAGTEFEPADLQRIIFLKAEASQWRLLPLSDEERTRTTLTSLMDGVQFGSADCSARYLSLVAIFGIEEAQRSIRAVDREPPTWQQLQAAFAPVLDPQSRQRFGLARARCWYGYGSLTYNPDARLNDLASVRQALELMLLAGEDGYVYALKPIDTILAALSPVYTQPIPTGAQQSRLDALRGE